MKTKPLKITDLNGFEIAIENLQLAIMQADDYRHYTHHDPKHRQADERQILGRRLSAIIAIAIKS